ncbi:MAG: hypothetical protein SFV81_05435 [Pirellulaceae bacterium]|nr:hypothetical protein [Pirellulaceae bacterium]
MRSKFLPIGVVLLLFFTCACIALYWLLREPRDHIGFLFGALYGHSTLSSGWMVFGPGKWPRYPLAFVWLIAIPSAFILNSLFSANLPASGFLWLSAGFIFVLVQVLAWPMRYWWRLRICRTAQATQANGETVLSHQFGIRELMILTTVVAIFLAGGPLLLPLLRAFLGSGEFAVFAFLVVASVVICIPTIFSILAMRKPIVPTLILFVFVTIATYIELPLLSSLGFPRGGPDRLHLILINVFSLLPIVIVCSMLRVAGYQLSSNRNQPQGSVANS